MTSQVSNLQNTTKAASPAIHDPGSGAISWAIEFLAAIGAPVTQSNIDLIMRWGNAESGGQQAYGGWTAYNPLNVVTQPGIPEATHKPTGPQIASFANEQQGVLASAHLFLQNKDASQIIATLRRGNATPQELTNVLDPFYTWDPKFSIVGTSPDPQATDPGATLTGSIPGAGVAGDIASGIGSAIGDLPIIGGLIKSGQATASLAGNVINLFDNWRYVAEVFAGVGLVFVGLWLVTKDLGVQTPKLGGVAPAPAAAPAAAAVPEEAAVLAA